MCPLKNTWTLEISISEMSSRAIRPADDAYAERSIAGQRIDGVMAALGTGLPLTSDLAITRQVRIGSGLRLIIILDLRSVTTISAVDPSTAPVDHRDAQCAAAVSCACAEDQRECWRLHFHRYEHPVWFLGPGLCAEGRSLRR